MKPLTFLLTVYEIEDLLFLFAVIALIILFLVGLCLSGIYIIYKTISKEKESYQGKLNLEVNDR